MKKIVLFSLLCAPLLSMPAFAIGDLLRGGMSGLKPSAAAAAAPAVDLEGFMVKATATNQLFMDSRNAIALALADKQTAAELKEKLKALASTTDPKEKQALVQAIDQSASQVIEQVNKDQAAASQRLSEADDMVKTNIKASFYNFALAAMQAKDLATDAQGVTSSLSNPTQVMKLGSRLTDIKTTVSEVLSIGKNASLALVEMPSLAKQAKIDLSLPTSSTAQAVQAQADFN